MENNRTNCDKNADTSGCTRKNLLDIVFQDRHKIGLMACISAGILFGCVTQTIYGHQGDWNGLVEKYCASVEYSFLSVAPVTMGLIVFMFICAPFELGRMLIYPAVAFRSMGIGMLICGAVRSGGLRELCFACLVLLPYTVTNCAVAVYAGEYSLGFRESFTEWNDGLSDNLYLHAIKMLLFYITIAALSCGVFAASCGCFEKYVI